MKTNADDEGVQAARDVRARISAEQSNDAKSLVDHYLAQQATYRERLLEPRDAADPADTADPTARHR